MASTIFFGDRIKAFREALQLNTAATIASGSVDPTVTAPGLALSIGSIYLSTSTGKVYTKHTTALDDTNFYEVQTSDSIAPLIADVADLVTLSGVAANSTDLGTFTGTTIPDNSDVKEALQALETEVEVKATRELDNLTTTAINADLLPDTSLTYDIGSFANQWQEVYLNYIGGGNSNEQYIDFGSSSGILIEQGGTKATKSLTIDTYSTDAGASSPNLNIFTGVATDRGSLSLTANGITVQPGTAGMSLSSRKITSLADPTADQDASTKKYVDDTIGPIATDVADLVTLSGVVANSTTLGTFTGTTIPDSSDVKEALQALETEVELKIDVTEKGANNGVATLDAGGKVPAAQLPNSIMEYKGTWAASTNTPTLANGTGNAGDVYVASDAGTVDFGAGNITFAAGDWVLYSGTIWEKSVNSNAVASVNGYTGVVVLDTTDVAEGSNLYFTETRVLDTDLAGFTSSPGNISPADMLLTALQKLDGNNLATQQNVDNLVILSGVVVDSLDLGTFTGATIPDNSDIKEALQALETAVETTTSNSATTELDNLTSTAVNADILPSASMLRNLGSNTLLWNVARANRYGTSSVVQSFTGDLNSTTTIAVANTTGLFSGQTITGPNIPDSTFILVVNTNTSIIISAAATATATGVTLKAAYSAIFRTEDQTTENSGLAVLRSGNVTTAKSGVTVVRSGSTTSGSSGIVALYTGNASSGGTTGDIELFTGTTSGTRGAIRIDANGISLDSADNAVNFNSNKLVNVADPTTAQDAATKSYVDNAALGNNLSAVAGESFAANTTFAVRYAITGETAGRIYKADNDATTDDNFYIIGLIMSTAALTAGDTVSVNLMGLQSQGSSDVAWNSADVGKPVFLDAAGALTITAPSVVDTAVVRAGIIQTTTAIFVQPQVVAIN